MLPALFDDRRRTLARISAMLVIGSAAVLPLTAQNSWSASARETGTTHSDAAPAAPGPMIFPAFSLRRDPFRPRIAAAPASGGTPNEMIAGQAAGIGVVLPPNAGAGADASSMQTPSGAGTVRAIVVGERPRALVDVGGAVRVLAVGDAIAGLTVTAITTAGVAFSDGSIWPLTGQH